MGRELQYLSPPQLNSLPSAAGVAMGCALAYGILAVQIFDARSMGRVPHTHNKEVRVSLRVLLPPSLPLRPSPQWMGESTERMRHMPLESNPNKVRESGVGQCFMPGIPTTDVECLPPTIPFLCMHA